MYAYPSPTPTLARTQNMSPNVGYQQQNHLSNSSVRDNQLGISHNLSSNSNNFVHNNHNSFNNTNNLNTSTRSLGSRRTPYSQQSQSHQQQQSSSLDFSQQNRLVSSSTSPYNQNYNQKPQPYNNNNNNNNNNSNPVIDMGMIGTPINGNNAILIGNTPSPGDSSSQMDNNVRRLEQRQKQIDYGKNTEGYLRYIKLVPKSSREKWHPETPNKYSKCSKRCWDGLIRSWRRSLHEWDPPSDDMNPNDDMNIHNLQNHNNDDQQSIMGNNYNELIHDSPLGKQSYQIHDNIDNSNSSQQQQQQQQQQPQDMIIDEMSLVNHQHINGIMDSSFTPSKISHNNNHNNNRILSNSGKSRSNIYTSHTQNMLLAQQQQQQQQLYQNRSLVDFQYSQGQLQTSPMQNLFNRSPMNNNDMTEGSPSSSISRGSPAPKKQFQQAQQRRNIISPFLISETQNNNNNNNHTISNINTNNTNTNNSQAGVRFNTIRNPTFQTNEPIETTPISAFDSEHLDDRLKEWDAKFSRWLQGSTESSKQNKNKGGLLQGGQKNLGLDVGDVVLTTSSIKSVSSSSYNSSNIK